MNEKLVKAIVLELLDNGTHDRSQIYEELEVHYGISKQKARQVCKEIKGEFITKLRILQSGFLEL